MKILTRGFPFALPLLMLAAAGQARTTAPSVADVAGRVKAEVAEEIASINAQDPMRATAYEAEDTISMECGRPASTGREAIRQALSMVFKREPAWRLRLVEEEVDVAASADMAVYRSTYNQDSMLSGAPATQRVNYIALFKKHSDGSWKIAWSVVSKIEPPHPR